MGQNEQTGQYDLQVLATDFVPDAKVAISVKATMERQEHRMKHINGDIRDLETRLNELRAQGASIQRRYDINNAILAPMRRLPPETLGEIFYHCLILHSKFSLTNAPLLLMHICRRWRRIVEGTPRLWTELSLENGFNSDTCSLISMWLSNSGSLPIDINCRSDQVNYDPKAIRLILENFHRFRSFTAELSRNLQEEIARQKRPIHAPSLDHVDLRWLLDNLVYAFPFSDLEDYIHAPRLSSFTLQCVPMRYLVSFQPSSIRSVTLLKENRTFLENTSLKFLESYNNLSSLDIFVPGWFESGHSRILLPSLEKFTIRFSSSEDPCPVLDTFQVPILREFEIHVHGHDHACGRHLMDCVDSLLGQNTALRRFSIAGAIYVDPSRLITLLSRLQELDCLVLLHSSLDDSIIKALTPDSEPLPKPCICPRLSTLEVAFFTCPWDILPKLVEKRTPLNIDATMSDVGYLQYICVRGCPWERNAFIEANRRCGGRLRTE